MSALPQAPMSRCLRESSQGWAIGLFCGIIIHYLIAKCYNHLQRRRRENEEFTPRYVDFELGGYDRHEDMLEEGTEGEMLESYTGMDGVVDFPKRVVVRRSLWAWG
ncbi:hypothetical protein N7466_002637 [Penicillium verhagenii]|uniref:uncharacterized protein n=1 Tax=Penicillium verhagenii TaxID=1562060 RepID=UPI002544DDA7|nr:uncharacterized protein N7466_002637 [Penicillium verhagenii]KAJ5939503.1 hypothetical protein N7466_002637 [Penicillium verhagenii]